MGVGLTAVLSGGGSKGAFQVGVLLALRRIGVEFDAFAGVSTGAIQALGGAMAAQDELLEYWLGIEGDSSIFGGIPPWPIASRNAGPFRNRLRRFGERANERIAAAGKQLRIGVVSLQSGRFRFIREDSHDLADWVYASCAVPIEFEPLKRSARNGTVTQWVDGGVRHVTPIQAAADELSPKAMIVIRASLAPEVPVAEQLQGTAAHVGLRAVDILQAEVSANDLAFADISARASTALRSTEAALRDEGVTDEVAQRILHPLRAFVDRVSLRPVLLIEPRMNFSSPHEFDPLVIRAAIAAGEEAVRSRKAEIEKFVEQSI